MGMGKGKGKGGKIENTLLLPAGRLAGGAPQSSKTLPPPPPLCTVVDGGDVASCLPLSMLYRHRSVVRSFVVGVAMITERGAAAAGAAVTMME